jgi:hypothetical protein
MLREHASAPRRTMTPQKLAIAGGYKSYSSANSQYGALGRKIAMRLNAVPEATTTGGKPLWTTLIADGYWKAGRHWHWRMHREVAEALHCLNMA